MLRSHWRYLSYVVRHKWFVLVAGLRVHAPVWRLLIHDWSKFAPAEWGPYVHAFYPYRTDHALPATGAAFSRAWLHHQHANAHHWQHWVLRNDDGSIDALPMPDPVVREMVADWMGAGRAITGKWEAARWYLKNRRTIQLHPESRFLAECLLDLATLPPLLSDSRERCVCRV